MRLIDRLGSARHALALLSCLWLCGGCSPPGLVLTIDADAVTADRLDAYCVNLGAEAQRRFGRRYAAADFPLPQTLGVRSDGRASVIARVDGLRAGLRTASRVASFAFSDGGGTRAVTLPLTRCVSSGPPLEAKALVPRATLAFAADRLAVIQTGAESEAGAQLVALSAQGGVRARFIGSGTLPADQFEAQTISAARGLVQQIAALDVDGDCADDLVVLAEGRSPSVWPSDVDGTPGEDLSRIAAVAGARGAAVGDVDRDGYADLVTVGADGASILLSDREGRYVEGPLVFDVQPSNGRSAALGDLDGDGRLDLVVGFATGPLRWWRADGAGNFALQAMPLAGSFEPTAIVLRDLDSDGDLDAIVATRNALPGLRLFFNDGRGGFTDRTAALVPADVDEDVLGLLVADVDGDCIDELVVLGAVQAPRLFGFDSSGFLDDRGLIGTTAAHAAAAGDLDGDGIVELLLAGTGQLSAWSRPPRVTQ